MNHAATACALQQTHRESVLMMEHEAKAEEGFDCQGFMEAFWGSLVSLSTRGPWGTHVPLQLLSSDMPLATILGMSATTHLWAVVDGGPTPTASILNVSEMPAL